MLHLRRADELHPRLNAFVHIDEAVARKQAQSVAAAPFSAATPWPLHGVPLTIKSCITYGWPCAAGSLCVKKSAEQRCGVGAATPRSRSDLLGNTNTPEFLMAYETDNRLSGKRAIHGARNILRRPAAARLLRLLLAVGGASAATGRRFDRVPPHFCAICGLKRLQDAFLNRSLSRRK